MVPWTAACQTPLSTGFTGKNTGVGSYFLLWEIFLTRDQTHIWQVIEPTSDKWILYHWATREALLHDIESKSLLEKAMAPRSSALAWKIPWMQEPGGLQSIRSLRVGHDWVTSLSLFTFMHWRRKCTLLYSKSFFPAYFMYSNFCLWTPYFSFVPPFLDSFLILNLFKKDFFVLHLYLPSLSYSICSRTWTFSRGKCISRKKMYNGLRWLKLFLWFWL